MTDGRTVVGDLDDDKACWTTRDGAVAHPDRDCPQLRNAESVRRSKAESLANDLRICLNCLGENKVDSSPNPRSTRKALEEMNPEDLGLSPLGSGSGGRSA